LQCQHSPSSTTNDRPVANGMVNPETFDIIVCCSVQVLLVIKCMTLSRFATVEPRGALCPDEG